MFGREVLDHVLAHIRREPAIALPRQEMCGVGAGDDVDGIDTTVLLLTDALEHPLGPRAFDADGNPRVLLLEHLAELFRNLQFPRGIEADFTLFPRRLDESTGNGPRLGRQRLDRLRENSPREQRRRSLERLAPGKHPSTHYVSSRLHPRPLVVGAGDEFDYSPLMFDARMARAYSSYCW